MNRALRQTTVKTTCPYCGVGCGVLATTSADGSVSVAGDPDHPANFGRLCSKGSALAETLDLDGRLLYPEISGERVSWDEATRTVAERFSDVIAEHGPDAVAFYVSGQILTEDYYIANKLMKGFIGSANIDTNSRLCMASSVAGHKRAFGTDTVPGTYEDLEEADVVVLVGSNLAWCHPVLFQRLMAAKEARPELVIVAIDPRRTMTARSADQHLALEPGSDVALFNGLLDHLERHGELDAAFIDAHTNGYAEALAVARETGFEGAVDATGLNAADLTAFYKLFGDTKKVVTVFSQGVNQSSSGTDKVNAIINCHLVTGRIGDPGMGPMSVTGQPNAMGGREVGGLANQLACHLDIENAAHRTIVQDHWQSPVIADHLGLKAVDMFDAVADGRIKAIWIMATNPVDSMPDADAVKAALDACPFVVVSDVLRHTDTTAHADVLLPALGWGEKDGTVTNSGRHISRQRAFLPQPGEARADWRIMRDVAIAMGRAMGWPEAFNYAGPADILREYAALSVLASQDGTRDFDIGACADLDNAAYDAMAPFQWPWKAGDAPVTSQRFFADGRFFTPDGRAKLLPTVPRAPASEVDDDYAFVLNTGRVRDHWHTMTRTAKSSRLSQHIAEPFAEIHPEDAEALGIEPASLVRVASHYGDSILRAHVTEDQRRGSVFVPIHWSGQYASAGRIDALVHPNADPISGQPESKYTPVSLKPFEARWYGYAVTANKPKPGDADYWALAKAAGGWRMELAGAKPLDDWDGYARALFGLSGREDVEMLSFHDQAGGRHRFAAFLNNKLVGALFIASEPVAVSRGWAVDHLNEAEISAGERLRLLAGRPGADRPDPGAIICSCFSIGINQITAAIESGEAASVEEIGTALKAGTNCGSCRSELKRILDNARLPEAV